MLQNLQVKNLALIDSCEVDLSRGLNILSGETGAGKSIIIGSINLALGEKVSREMLRDKDKDAYVELVFTVDNPRTLDKLKELEVEPEDGCVIISRRISPQRAIGRINGEAASISHIKEVAAQLIDIHGQHEHQSLLSRKKHLELLDEYASDSLIEKKEELAGCFREYKKLKEEFDNSNIDDEGRKRELEFLEFEISEIQSANLIPGEDEELEKDFRKFSNGRKIMEALGSSFAATGEQEGCAAELIGSAVRQLGMVSEYDSNIASLESLLAEIDSLLSDFNHDLSNYIAGAEFDEEKFHQTEMRLDQINHLKSKYGNTIEAVLEALESKSQRVSVLKDYDRYLKDLAAGLEKKERELSKISEEVSDIRKAAAQEFTEAVTKALKDLNFLDVRFQMHFERKADYSLRGIDDPEFLISTNPGEELKPLGKIASGGELSRIMLAIKTVMAEKDHIDTLIFDEIDSGISGRTAQMVSEKMNELGKCHQVICITHLPQIAAMADAHYLIEKSVENDVTTSNIYKLDKEQSVVELARMLGGVEITDTVISNAREMKAMAGMKK